MFGFDKSPCSCVVLAELEASVGQRRSLQSDLGRSGYMEHLLELVGHLGSVGWKRLPEDRHIKSFVHSKAGAMDRATREIQESRQPSMALKHTEDSFLSPPSGRARNRLHRPS